MSNFMLWFVKITGVLPFLAWYKPRRYYEGDRKEKPSGEILIANHTTLWDLPMMMFVVPLRTVRVLMAEVLFRNPLSAWFMKRMRGIRVNRDTPENTDKLREAMEELRCGGIVGVFPEGRLNPGGKRFGPFLPFNSGAAYLALKTGAKVRPLYFNVHGGIFRSSQILVGEAIDLRAMFGESTSRENLTEATKFLRRTMEEMRETLKFRSRHKERSLTTRFVNWSATLGMKIAFHFRVHVTDPAGCDRKLTKPCIIASNHVSVFDPPLLCTVFSGAKLHMLACESLYDYPLLAKLLRRLGCIKIDRNILDVEAFHLMRSMLQKNESVGIFPEGKLSADGKLGEFKPGTILAAVASDVDVIPVYLSENVKAFSRKGRDVWIGKPLRLTGALTPENIQRGTDLLYHAIQELEAEAKRSETK